MTDDETKKIADVAAEFIIIAKELEEARNELRALKADLKKFLDFCNPDIEYPLTVKEYYTLRDSLLERCK